MSLTVLIHEWVTGGGLGGSPLPRSWEAEGAAMRRAIVRDFASVPPTPTRVIVTLDRRLPDESGPWEIVRISEGEEVDRVLSYARRADFTLVIAPETGGVLRGWAQRLELAGLLSLGSSSEAIAIAGDKLLFASRLLERNVPTPRTHLVESNQALPPDAVYPAVLKPIDGAGGMETYLVESSEFRLSFGKNLSGMLLQSYVPGESMSASFFVDGAGVPHKIGIGKQRIVVRSGRFEYLGGELPVKRAVDEGPLRSAILAVPGLRGFVGVDFVRDRETGSTTVIEINPRPTTSCVGLCMALEPGRLASAWLAACGGEVSGGGAIFEQLADDLAGRRPVSFAADGTILPTNSEVS